MDSIKEFFAKKKSIALAAAVSMAVAYEFSRINVPEVVENKFSYRTNYIIEKILVKVASLASSLNMGSEPALIRSFTNYFNQYSKNKSAGTSRVNKIDSAANDIPIRIYFPKKVMDLQMPLMIYFHGGGYVLRLEPLYDRYLTWLVEHMDIIVVSIDYHLAPEYEYPIPIEECYIAASYFIENLHEYDLNVDKNRIILAGDSAGANIATIISGKLRELDANTPKLQILINPPTQYFNFLLPSIIKYSYLDVWLNRPKQVLWHLGMNVVTEAHCDVLVKNQHTLLLDEKTKEKFRSFIDVDLIPSTYKQGKSYYEVYEHVARSLVYQESLNTNSLLRQDNNFESLVMSLFNTNISPGLADDETLKRQPTTYMIVSEFDSRKDEGLIYSERLIRAGVVVQTAFYEKGFHCSILYDTPVGNAMKMDLIKYIKANV